MNVHKNSRLTPYSRAGVVRRVLEEGQSRTAVAAAFGVDRHKVGKWLRRFQAEGPAGLAEQATRQESVWNHLAGSESVPFEAVSTARLRSR